MSFRKRNVALSNTTEPLDKAAQTPPKAQLPGVKHSSIDGRPVTSTGTATLDGLLAGHGGLPLGCSLLIEENGTTDYAGALLKFYAAEGILQGHHVHVLGLPEQWGRELPGAVSESDKKDKPGVKEEKMKIAWRYENLGQFGASTAGSRESLRSTPSPTDPTRPPNQATPYNHTFDLTKRLQPPPSFTLTFHPILPSPPNTSPYNHLLTTLTNSLTTNPTTPHRVLLPSLLSPLLYPPSASHPHHLLPLLHALRSLLSQHPLTILSTLPLPLSPRSTGLTRWLELLHDGVIELSPFPHSAGGLVSSSSSSTTISSNNKSGKAGQKSKGSSASKDNEEQEPQGLLKIHRLPVLTDRGVGVRAVEDDWAFTLSRRRLAVREWRLGPVEDEVAAAKQDAGGDTGGGEAKGKKGKEELDF